MPLNSIASFVVGLIIICRKCVYLCVAMVLLRVHCSSDGVRRVCLPPKAMWLNSNRLYRLYLLYQLKQRKKKNEKTVRKVEKQQKEQSERNILCVYVSLKSNKNVIGSFVSRTIDVHLVTVADATTIIHRSRLNNTTQMPYEWRCIFAFATYKRWSCVCAVHIHFTGSATGMSSVELETLFDVLSQLNDLFNGYAIREMECATAQKFLRREIWNFGFYSISFRIAEEFAHTHSTLIIRTMIQIIQISM